MFLSGAQSPFPDSYEGLQNSIATSVEHRTRCILAGCQVGIPSDLSGPPFPCHVVLLPLISWHLISSEPAGESLAPVGSQWTITTTVTVQSLCL